MFVQYFDTMYSIFYLQIVLKENVHLYLLLRSNLTNQFPPKRLLNGFVILFNKLTLVLQYIPLGLLGQQMLYVVVFHLIRF